MASRALLDMGGASAPLDMLLSSIPSLPRPLLDRLVARMIEHMDEIDGDADLEAEEDQCEARDDGCGPCFDHINNRVCWGADQEAGL